MLPNVSITTVREEGGCFVAITIVIKHQRWDHPYQWETKYGYDFQSEGTNHSAMGIAFEEELSKV